MKLLKQQELVVGGWTEPRLSRTHFGALLVGYYDEAGVLRWAGSVGTGFDQAELERVAQLLRAREIESNPFVDPVRTIERAHWVTPDLVAEVRFTEWTDDDLLRHPVYLGLRSDKRAKDVRREEPKRGSARAIVRGPRPWDWRSARREPEAPAAPRTVATPARREAAAATSSETGTGLSSALRAVIEKLSLLEDARKDGEVVLPNGDALRVTNLAKLFWPDLKITKGELMRYYVQVAPFALAAVADRPLVMKRFPNGVDTHAFYQQKHPEAVPPGVRREVLAPEVDPPDEDGPRERLIGGSITTLVYMTQLAAISQDPWFSRVNDPMHMDHAAIDLDPGEGAGFDQVLDVARWVKDELDHYGIPAVPKTSGSRGIHIYIPLPKRTTYETGQLLCQMIAAAVADKHPKTATVQRMVKKRPRGTVYVDYLQNILGKTLATAYSARASAYAGVSTPLTWDEVARGLDPRDFTIRTAPARFRAKGDLWAPIRTGKPVDLKAVLRRQARRS
jgi:bifunctional non-homologous end joining protein LigD